MRQLPTTRHALLAGVSLSALTLARIAPAAAGAPPPLSPAWFAARVDASTAQAAAAQAGAAATLTRVTTASRDLATLALRLQQMRMVQGAAAAAATAGSVPNGLVPNGLVMGGLQVAAGATAGSPLWMGAALPTQSVSGAITNVTVRQTQAQAMLTWQSFNVGRQTALTFDQSAGGTAASGWVVLNRVEDPAAAPSQILGSIRAPGRVYVINPNGIVFGAGAQVNLGALIASTANITAAQFAGGIYGAQAGADFAPSFTGAAADSAIIVDAGAEITTAAPAGITSGGGSVILLGGTVQNAGEITTPQGQTVLAAGQDFILRAGYSSTSNQGATVIGSQVEADGAGAVTNTGLIVSTLGDITLVGHDVTQAGIALATTSVNTRGSIHLLTPTDDATANVTLAAGSVTSVDPDDAATTALDSQRQSLIAQSLLGDAQRRLAASAANPQLNDVSALPDRLDLSRVEITTGGVAQFDDGSLTVSQGGQIAVQAGRQAWVGDGATLDVSGSTAAVLAASSNALAVTIEGNELRDAPVNRDTGLITNATVTLDLRDLVQVAALTGGDPNARDYTAGGLLEVGGYLSNIGHTIDEWDAIGGKITLAAPAVVTQPQATLDIAGGAVTVQAGELAQSYLIGADGMLYNANTAPANIAYVGVYGGLAVQHPRFGGTDVYVGTLAAPAQIAQPGYTYGRDAGSLVVTAETAALEGRIDAGVTNGADQTGARAAGVTDPYNYSQTTIALPGTLAVAGYTATGTLLDPFITIGAITPVAEQIGPGTVPVGDTIALSAAQLDAEGLGGLSAITGAAVQVTAPLTLAPGGTLTLQGDVVHVAANLTARGGRITIGDVGIDPVTLAVVAPSAGTGKVAIDGTTTIDLRGEYTNVASDPGNLAGIGLVDGGTLVVDSARALEVAAGTTIDASSGAALLAGGRQRGGVGGSVTLIGDDPFYAIPGNTMMPPVVIAPTLRDFGVAGGGTLTLTAPRVLVGTASGSLLYDTIVLPAQSFQAGFAHYVINGFDRLDVAPDTEITVAEPVYTFYGDTAPADVPTGADPSAALQLILPPSFTQDAANGRLTQRQGASVAFLSNDRPGVADIGGGAITIGAGSRIDVDPGQSVRIEAYGQITDDGRIDAAGGTVAIVNEERERLPAGPLPTLSIWIGGDAVVDVAGLAATALDTYGRSYGLLTAGGTIDLGSDGGVDGSGSRIATDAQVLVRPGALLDASGAAATIDLLAGTTPVLGVADAAQASDPVAEATQGGAIVLSSYSAISLDGTAIAPGGTGAAGGTLSMTLETPVYTHGTDVPDILRRPHIITISADPESALAGDTTLQAGGAIPVGSYGNAYVSQAQIDAGGFSTLSLYARDAFLFDGQVALHTPGSIRLSEGILTASQPAMPVSIAAPYVQLSGQTNLGDIGDSIFLAINTGISRPSTRTSRATLTVSADLIDLSNNLRLGVDGSLPLAAGGATTRAVDLAGFANLVLDSAGDIRFGSGTLTTPGDITLIARQIYPTTQAVAAVYAGYDEYGSNGNLYLHTGTITIQAAPGSSAPPIPFSVGGSLKLAAGQILQGGVLRAPEGSLTLGAIGTGPTGLLPTTDLNNAYTYQVTLLPGSITSVSLDGATIPYGGTVDGVTYSYDGAPITTGFSPSVTIASQLQTVAAGATLDLSGGGTLAGSGFITGRGGSTNLLTTPLLAFDAATGSVTAASLATDGVYAILPGYGSDYAPTSPLEASATPGLVPAIGSQVTIGAGVPGIAAGTYTLLPAYYALLPGAARIQIDTGRVDAVPGTIALGAGSFELDVATSVANTPAAASPPVQAIVTTGAGVLANAQFDQQSYSSFLLGEAARYDTPRAQLPEDANTLNLQFPEHAALVSALDVAGTVLFDAAPGYDGGQATVGGTLSSPARLEITAAGATPTHGYTAVAADQLDALGASRLVVGGVLQLHQALPNQEQFIASDDAVAVRDGAVIAAPEVFLVAGSPFSGPSDGSISVDGGAVVDTIGSGAPPYDSTSGIFYDSNGNAVVAVSNGQLIFKPDSAGIPESGAITIAGGATLLTSGTLNFVTAKSLSLSDAASYGAASLSLDVANIDVLSAAAAAQAAAGTLVLPAGLILTQDVLTRLLQGDPALGVPALQSLVLTAAQSFNFAGSVSLDTLNPLTGQSTLRQFVLNTPAIYGAGSAGDVASITTDTLYWNGIGTAFNDVGVAITGSALPGGVVANGPGTGTGTLTIDARNIVLGSGPNTQPDDQVTLDRIVEGFSDVALVASQSLSANGRGALSVYEQAGAVPGGPGTGGTLLIDTPLLTGAAGSVDSITAGGTLTIASSAPSAATAGALGAQLDLTAAAIADDSTILLDAGRLQLTAATGDIDLGAQARIDLAGLPVTLLDQTRFSQGGTLALTAGAGSIRADAASVIDVAATAAAAGAIEATALDGLVALDGTLQGGTTAGQAAGSLSLRAGTIDDFDALNARLDAGGLTGSRSFELATGDLTVDATVTAHRIAITTDAGSLTITGTLDAAGAAPGAITLAAGGDLAIADGALLDAHGSVLQADSTGAAIDSENQASVALTTTGGTLRLGAATIDVASADPVPLGVVTLQAPRSVVDGTETGDIAIQTTHPVTILGAASIGVYGARTYTPTDANGTIEQHAAGAIAGAVTLDELDADDTGFIDAAATNPTLAAQLAGLGAYTAILHLRPADTIASSAASGGNLTVDGDLDLATLRTGPTAQAGLLSLRAANNLVVNGSITDGFETPPDAAIHTKDDNGWVLYANEPLGQNVTLPTDLALPVTLASGSIFSTTNAVALNYAIPISAATLRADVVIPTGVVTARPVTIGAGGFTATATITAPDGSVLATAGQVLPAGLVIAAGSTLAAGTVLPSEVSVVRGTVWPAGASLLLFSSPSVRLSLGRGNILTLPGGAFIPSGSMLVFPSGAAKVAVRAQGATGTQGLIYALAALMPAGSQSWSINLVAGADLASANVLAVLPQAALASQPGTATDPGGSVVLSDTHYTDPKASGALASFSVIRTGTGTLNLVAGGNVDEASLFGVYTAGTQTLLGTPDDALFQTGRSVQPDGTVLGKGNQSTYGAVIAGQTASYAGGGGNVLVDAQNSVLGDIIGLGANEAGTDLVGNWLWKQGGAGLGQATAWWINFGSYVVPLNAADQPIAPQPALVGFTGIGALGGGNVTVHAGGDAGEIGSISASASPISQGLVIAVADTGRVSDAGTVLTGGGALDLSVGGTLNPTTQGSVYAGLGGTLTDMRGTIDVTAGQVGRIDLDYDIANPTDPRPLDPFSTGFATSRNGITLVQGDGAASIDAMRDLVLAGAGDAGRENEQALTFIPTSVTPAQKFRAVGGDTGFTLWTDDTAIDLFSAGGNLTPTTAAVDGAGSTADPNNDGATDGRFVIPSTLDAVAASGSIYYGQAGNGTNQQVAESLELAPAPDGQLAMLAAGSIFAHGYTVDMSGAAVGAGDLPTPDDPSYTDLESLPFGPGAVTSFRNSQANTESPEALFSFEADTPTTVLHAGDSQPARFYAVTGDLVDLQFGEAITYPIGASGDHENPDTWYIAAKSGWLIAGRDIVASGTRPQEVAPGTPVGTFQTFPNEAASSLGDGATSGDLFLNTSPTDVSVVSAGRDILSSYLYVAGPGTLQVDAGRNIDDSGNNNLQFGLIKSLGPVVDVNASDRSSGASLAVLAGTGAAGPDIAAFAALYLNPANQADLAIPLSDPANAGKVQQTYQVALLAFLQSRYGYTGPQADALAFFEALPSLAQSVFVRQVFYQELTASGRQESDSTSLFYRSYARGRLAIATLFPAAAYSGGITLDSGTLNLAGIPTVFDAGISTLFGGDIQLLSPGGGDVFGVAGGPAPGANSGVLTYGDGNIDIYALDSVLLGQSRIFTTFGGNILIWSAQGDINAGRGAKTTTVEPPPLIAYDPFGGITLAPTAPTSGAGIATLAPLAGITPGDVDLVAPLGTIDAGEAGIRVSGNLNIAALMVLNAANVQVQGRTSGSTAVVATNTAAATAAAAAAGSSINAATDTTPRRKPQPAPQPSVITVEVVDAGNERYRPAA